MVSQLLLFAAAVLVKGQESSPIPTITPTYTRTPTQTPSTSSLWKTALCADCAQVDLFPQGDFRYLNGSQLAGGTDAWVQVLLWGGGGACAGGGSCGGSGAYLSGVLRVRGNETLRIVVGAAGGSPLFAGDCPGPSSGGGRSAVQRLVAVNASYAVWADVATAGGGGAGICTY